MKAIGFNFKKISAERLKGSDTSELKVNTNIKIEDMKRVDTNIFKDKNEIIQVDFDYGIDYKPDFAKLNLSGSIILSIEPKKAKSMLKDWKKKKISEEVTVPIYNLILKRSTLKALELEEELNLPTHMPLPSFKKKE